MKALIAVAMVGLLLLAACGKAETPAPERPTTEAEIDAIDAELDGIDSIDADLNTSELDSLDADLNLG